MVKDLMVFLEDKPGTLASLGEALGKAGVNIEGVCGVPSEGMGVFHILVEDAPKARQALEGAVLHVHGERDVLLLDIKDAPGEFGKICRKIASAGININLCYLATKTRLVLGVDEIAKARTVLGQ